MDISELMPLRFMASRIPALCHHEVEHARTAGGAQ
jgi:hypothetical protein